MFSYELILASFSTAISSLAYLILSKILDNFIHPVYADAIGKLLDLSLDFIFQSYIFLDKLNPNKIPQYLLSKLISTSISIGLFSIYIKKYKNKSKIDNTFIRMFIATSCFFLVAYPLSKYFVFKEN